MPLPVPAVRLWAYDRVMLDLSTAWYAHILRSTPAGHHLLDVGCGPFSAQAANASLLVTRDLRLTGVDTDVGYLQAARSRAMEAGIGDRVTLERGAIEAHGGGPYDGACLVASIMLVHDPVAVLRHVGSLLAPGAPIWLAMTVNLRPAPALAAVKPALRWVTGVRFGRVTYPDTIEGWMKGSGRQVQDRVETGRKEPFAWWVVRTVPAADPRPGG